MMNWASLAAAWIRNQFRSLYSVKVTRTPVWSLTPIELESSRRWIPRYTKLRDVFKYCNLTRGSVLIGTTIAAGLTVHELSRDTILVDSFEIPKPLQDRGLTNNVLLEHIQSALRDVRESAIFEFTGNQQVNVALLATSGDDPEIDFEIPETHISVKKVAQAARKILGIQDTRISGEIVTVQDFLHEGDGKQLKVLLHVSSSEGRHDLFPVMLREATRDKMAVEIALRILEEVDPVTYVQMEWSGRQGSDFLPILSMPRHHEKHAERRHLLWADPRSIQ